MRLLMLLLTIGLNLSLFGQEVSYDSIAKNEMLKFDSSISLVCVHISILPKVELYDDEYSIGVSVSCKKKYLSDDIKVLSKRSVKELILNLRQIQNTYCQVLESGCDSTDRFINDLYYFRLNDQYYTFRYKTCTYNHKKYVDEIQDFKVYLNLVLLVI